MKLDILYEDEALVFINKPAGIVVQQRMHEPDEPFLHDLVMRHTSPAYLMQRLDRGTSGVIFFSKRADLNVRLTRQFERKRIRKRYLAICDGELARAADHRRADSRASARSSSACAKAASAPITHVAPLAASAVRLAALASISRPAARIRSACIWPPSVTHWQATGSMERGTRRGRCCTRRSSK